MATYMKLTGMKQGVIKGAVEAEKFTDQIEIHTLKFGLGSASLVATGQVTGRKVIQPLVVTKSLDKSSPLIVTACDNNESVKATITYTKEGLKHEGLVVLEITNGLIADFTHTMDATGNGYEILTFTFSKLDFTWCDGGIMASMDWTIPVT